MLKVIFNSGTTFSSRSLSLPVLLQSNHLFITRQKNGDLRKGLTEEEGFSESCSWPGLFENDLEMQCQQKGINIHQRQP